jgi:putative ABC transport system ATP-binding protein
MRKVVKKFKDFVALKQIDFSVGRQEVVVIIGPSGSGKSTAMNIIGYLDTPSGGEYLFDGVPVQAVTREQRTLLRMCYGDPVEESPQRFHLSYGGEFG